MLHIVFLLLCMMLGLWLKKSCLVSQQAHLTINTLLLYICLPAATLLHTSETVFVQEYGLAIAMPWLVFGVSFAFFSILDRYIAIDRASKAALILTAGIPSISFVGFPIFEALYGKKGLEIGIMMSQAGSFLVCSTLGVMLASYFSAAHVNLKQMLLNVLRFPTFIAFCVAICINFSHLHLPLPIRFLLEKLAQPFSFLALLSIGLQIPLEVKNWQTYYLKWGLFYKLLLAPLLILVLYGVVFQKKGFIFETSVLGASLGPMNTVAIMASHYKLNPSLVSQMVGIGIPLSLLTSALFYFLLGF